MKKWACISIACLVSSNLLAQELLAIKVEPSDIAVRKPVQITLEFKEISEQGACNVLVNFGDGRSEDIRVEAKSAVVKVSHTYESVGNYPISAEGKAKFRGFNTVFGCSGDTRSTALVVREEDYADKAAAAEEEKKAAYERAAAEARAAKLEAERAARDRVSAGSAARRAAAEKEAALKAANAAAADRAAQERAAVRARVAAERAEKAAALASEPPRTAASPKKPATPPLKAGSATDL